MNAQSLLGVLLLAASATPPLPTPHEVGRERITAAVVEKIRFEGELAAWSDAERTAFLEELGIDRMAATCVPKTALASSRAAADAVLRSCVTHLGYNDRELNRLAVEKALMDAVLILEQTRYLPRLDEQGRARLQQSVTETMDRAEGIVSAQLSDIIPREEIEKAGRHAVSDLLQRMNDVTSYQMKQAADAKELDRLLHVFEERLTISRERAVRRMEALDQLRQRHGLADAELAALRQREMNKILDEVLYPLTRSLRRATSPRKLLELDRDPDQILPGYGALVRRWSQRQQEVASDRLKSRMEAQNRRRRLRETTAIPISFDLDATLGDLGLDAPVQSEAQEPVPADAESTVEAPRTSEEVTSGKGRRTSQPQDDGAPKSQGVSACWLGTVFGLGATGVAVAVLLARLRLRRRRMK